MTSPTHHKRLIKDVLSQMAVRVTIVVIVVTALTYIHIMGILKQETTDKLVKYIDERGKKESLIFGEVTSNLKMFKNAYLDAHAQEDPFTLEQFLTYYENHPDGSFRTKEQYFTGYRDDSGLTIRDTSSWISSQAPQHDLNFLRHVTIAYQILNLYGPVLGDQQNLYTSFLDNAVAIYWKDWPWALEVHDAYDANQEEYMLAATKKHNPSRTTSWSKVYFDETSDVWMVSGILPVDIDGQHIFTIGQDILLNDLFKRVLKDRLKGTYNFILRKDGLVIIHPEKMTMEGSRPPLDASTTDDPTLKNIYQALTLVDVMPQKSFILKDLIDDSFVATTTISGPNWWFVTVYPKSLLQTSATSATRYVLILSFLALLIEIFMLYFLIRKKVTDSLELLQQATGKIADGDYKAVAAGEVPLPEHRRDEIGDLAKVFRQMGQNIYEYEEKLKGKVLERTRELHDANRSLDERNAELAKKNQAILTAQNQVLVNEKMATLGTLAAGVAHELNNPNNFILGALQVWEKDTKRFKEMLRQMAEAEGDQEVTDLLMKPFNSFEKQAEIIRDGSARISEVVKDMRCVSRLDEAELKIVDLLEGIRATIGLVRSQHPQVHFQLDLGDPIIQECNPGELNQVYLSIILNACRAIEDQCKLDPHATAQLTIKSKKANNWILIQFSDTGCGIPKQHLEKIFEAFFTTREPGDGNGLGLYTAWRIIKKHGGSLEVESEVGKGTILHLKLPDQTKQSAEA